MALLGVTAIVFMSLMGQNILEDGLMRVENVFKDSKKVQKIQKDFIIPLFMLREETLSLVVAPDGYYKRSISESLTPLIKELDSSFNSLDEEIRDIWKNYKKLVFTTNGYKNYKRFVYLSDGYILEDYKKGALLHTKGVERKQFYILIAKLKDIQKKQLEKSHSTFKKAKDSFLQKQNIIIFGAMIVVVLTLLFGFLIARNIVFSIEIVQDGLGRFFDLLGRQIDKDEEISIKLKNRDEFGDIAKIINTNVEILRVKLKKDIKLIEDATHVLHQLKKGDLEIRLSGYASSDELNKLKHVMNEMLDNLEDRIVLEIKNRTKQEQLLIQQSKLASMGNMIGNIAHQWRQPLSVLNAVLIKIQVKKEHNDLSDDELYSLIEECDIILAHMSNTISDFQNFFKPSKEKTKFDLELECKNASFIIKSSLKYNNIKFDIVIEKDCKVIGYPREFAQAILNILSNAKDILIERNVKNPYIKLTLQKGDKYALIKIEDNAGGVDEKIKDRIFEPYFTTKHAKKGTGIGLYMSKIIIEENMHGFIDVSNTEEGALFIIKLAL